MDALDITDVVRATGVPAHTLRYYEDRGLIAPVGRRGLRRVYDPAVVLRLALIALGRAAGFSLDEIGGMLADEGVHIDRAALRARADVVDQRIRRLTTLRDGLRHAADCKAEHHLACPTFQALVAAAGRGALEPDPEAPRGPSRGRRRR